MTVVVWSILLIAVALTPILIGMKDYLQTK